MFLGTKEFRDQKSLKTAGNNSYICTDNNSDY